MQAHVSYRLHDGMGIKIRHMPDVQDTNIIKIMNLILLTLAVDFHIVLSKKETYYYRRKRI